MDVMVLGLYLNVCGLYCENPWYYQVCEDYNGIVSKILCDEWVNPQILSIQSLLTTSPLTMAPSLSPNSHTPLLKPWTWNSTSLLDIIRRLMDKWNVQIKPWNSISASIALINRTTGIYYYPLLNLHITMPRTPPPESPHSLPTKVTILISLFILNVISPPLRPATL